LLARLFGAYLINVGLGNTGLNMPIESALVILVPEAEVLVESFRLQHDPSAALGVPAHVTVLYPFKPPRELTAEVIKSLEELFSEFPGFSISFIESRRFPDVLYLSPVPHESIRSLIEMVARRFPETPPYGGQFADIVPHLTVAQVGDPRKLDEIESKFASESQGHLPVRTSVTEVTLLDNESGRWQVRRRFSLDTDDGTR
jgi:2'-5' RNA ligase